MAWPPRCFVIGHGRATPYSPCIACPKSGSSVRISVVVAELSKMISAYHTQFVEQLAPFSDAVRMTSAGALTGTGCRIWPQSGLLLTQEAGAVHPFRADSAPSLAALVRPLSCPVLPFDQLPLSAQLRHSRSGSCYARNTSISLKNPVFGRAREA
jgi:hypothetical protein